MKRKHQLTLGSMEKHINPFRSGIFWLYVRTIAFPPFIVWFILNEGILRTISIFTSQFIPATIFNSKYVFIIITISFHIISNILSFNAAKIAYVSRFYEETSQKYFGKIRATALLVIVYVVPVFMCLDFSASKSLSPPDFEILAAFYMSYISGVITVSYINVMRDRRNRGIE